MPPKRVILAIIIIAIILLIWSGTGTRTTGTDELADKIWVDRVPEEPRDLIDVMLFDTDHGFGILAKQSSFRLNMDFVEFEASGDTVRLNRLQEDRTTTHRVRTWECKDGEAPPDFDYCMDFDGRKFFGRELREGEAQLLEMHRP